MKYLVLSVVVAAAFGVVLSLPFTLPGPKKQALIPTIRELGATKFAHYVHEANLTANFTRKAGNFTLFVPDNNAWTALSHKTLNNKTLLRELVLFHSVNGTYMRNKLKNGTKLKTLSGKFLHFNVTSGKNVSVNGVNITKYNKLASNGVIYIVSEVILNGSGVHNKSHHHHHTKTPHQEVIHVGREALIPHLRTLGATKFAHYVHEANLTANFTKKAGNFTLFVPDNKAWESLSHKVLKNKTLLRELILFHSVNRTYGRHALKDGKKLRTLSGKFLFFNVTKTKAVLVNGVNITKFNQWASNGNIFLLNEVILNGSGIHNKTNTIKASKSTHLSRRQGFINCPLLAFGRNCSHHGNGSHGNGTHGNHTVGHFSHFGHGNNSHGNGTHGNRTHGSITDFLSTDWKHYSTLITDIMKSGLWTSLEKDHVTLLAPTNAAFQSLPPSYRHSLDSNPELLKRTMMYHIVNGDHAPNTLHANTHLTSLEGHRIHVSLEHGRVSHFNKVSINNVIHAFNGYIYVLNSVLHLPQNPIV